ncbi:MAG: CorA family divalent cation transporter [Zavarzinella sp.]
MRVDSDRSSLTFVKPFLYDHQQSELVLSRVRSVHVPARTGVMEVWERGAFPTDDFLHHIAQSLAPTDDSPAVAEKYLLTNRFLESEHGLAAKKGFLFQFKNQSTRIRLEELQLILFRNGVGFVVQRWKVESDKIEAWLDLQHFGRFAALERGGVLRMPSPDGKSVRPFPQPYLQTADDKSSSEQSTFAAINHIALNSVGLGLNGPIPVQEVFLAGRSLPYTVLFLNETNDSAWPREKVLYKLRRLFHAQQAYYPTQEQVAICPPNFHPYLQDQWFFQSLEGGGFVAIDPPIDPFFQKELPHHLENEYFVMFLLALQQRFSLMSLSNEVAQRWKSNPAKQPASELRVIFEQIRDRLFDYTAHYHFVQVGQRQNHHHLYQLWQQTFQITDLYEEVNNEVREMNDYLNDRDKQSRDNRLNLLTLLLTVFIGAPTLAISFWSMNIKGITTAEEGLLLSDAVSVVFRLSMVFALFFGLIWYLLRRK